MFDLPAFLHTAVALSVSFVLGAVIGLERQYRQRTAGLRTNTLVAVGAAAFVDLGVRLSGPDGSVRVIAYVVSGIGFLGAGVIMKDGGQVRGLNTAATLWSTAAVGAFSGAGLPGEAILVALFVLAGNTLLRPLVEFVDRRPLNPDTTEALYRMHVICRPEHVSAARDLLADELEHHHYPIRDIETLSESDEHVELAALLVPTSADPQELDMISDHIARSPDVISATWSVSTTN
ncbi:MULTISPECIES: MgtC/SapB family protein [Nguyenibacter]|uniref:Protein MgtC n=1 Tax=Nguyenibacter vanlangensis TaxID=1216886 RepID=A0ABZ3D927_9PROT|nr:MgtC/SapB family protein [Nguyenibacter sp. L1]WRH88821.1 MgtC/SapB family protein [Nguyenibacter sp. L1]